MRFQLIILPSGEPMMAPTEHPISEAQFSQVAEAMRERKDDQGLPLMVSWPIDIVDLREVKR